MAFFKLLVLSYMHTTLYISFFYTLSNVDAGETAPTPVTTVLSLQNLMDANKFLVLFNVI